ASSVAFFARSSKPGLRSKTSSSCPGTPKNAACSGWKRAKTSSRSWASALLRFTHSGVGAAVFAAADGAPAAAVGFAVVAGLACAVAALPVGLASAAASAKAANANAARASEIAKIRARDERERRRAGVMIGLLGVAKGVDGAPATAPTLGDYALGRLQVATRSGSDGRLGPAPWCFSCRRRTLWAAPSRGEAERRLLGHEADGARDRRKLERP